MSAVNLCHRRRRCKIAGIFVEGGKAHKKSLNIPKSMFFPHARVYVKFIEIKKSPLNVRISSSSFEVLEQRNYVVKSSDK